MNPWELLVIGLGWILFAILALFVLIVVLGIIVGCVKSARDAARRKSWRDRETRIIDRELGLDGKGKR